MGGSGVGDSYAAPGPRLGADRAGEAPGHSQSDAARRSLSVFASAPPSPGNPCPFANPITPLSGSVPPTAIAGGRDAVPPERSAA